MSGFKIKTTIDLTKKIQSAARSMDGVSINVGVMSGDHAWLAGIHEYGCTIPVTDKMRAYLHSIGVHLKESTKQIIIPERSFLRSGYDLNRDDVLKSAERVLADVLGGTLSEEEYFELIGTTLRDAIKEYAIDLSEPPKKAWPTRNPAKNNPLVDTGDMINGIEYELER